MSALGSDWVSVPVTYFPEASGAVPPSLPASDLTGAPLPHAPQTIPNASTKSFLIIPISILKRKPALGKCAARGASSVVLGGQEAGQVGLLDLGLAARHVVELACQHP